MLKVVGAVSYLRPLRPILAYQMHQNLASFLVFLRFLTHKMMFQISSENVIKKFGFFLLWNNASAK